MLERSDSEIDDVINATIDAVDEGTSAWPGMSYEQGVEAALRWVTGQSDDNPMAG